MRCASPSKIQSTKLKVLDGLIRANEDRIVCLEAQTVAAKAQFPLPLFGNIEKIPSEFNEE